MGTPGESTVLGLLRIAGVCAELQVSRGDVMTAIRSGELPATRAHHQVGRPLLVERAALETWLDEQRAATRRYVQENPPGYTAMWDPDTGEAPR